MTKQQFESVKAIFRSEYDPSSKKMIENVYNKDQFTDITPVPVPEGERDPQSLQDDDDLGQFDGHLFDLAAKKRIDELMIAN